MTDNCLNDEFRRAAGAGRRVIGTSPPEPPVNDNNLLSDDGLTDQERALADAALVAAEREYELARVSIAVERGLLPSDARFLYGDDEEEIAASADAFKALLDRAAGVEKPPPPDLKQGHRGSVAAPLPNDPNTSFATWAREQRNTGSRLRVSLPGVNE